MAITHEDLKNRVYIRKGAKLEGLELDGCLVIFECDQLGTFDEMFHRTIQSANNCTLVNCRGTTAEVFSQWAAKLTLQKVS
ncbi:MAG: hypothetical protein RR326_02940 [Stenotrophomonas sp.]